MRVFAPMGAGVSAESGLATPEPFAADPAPVHRFCDWRRHAAPAAAPEAAHAALARLERAGALDPCTRNVDDLHERAGSARVHRMHGELARARCPACTAARPRPDIVWFGETPRGLDAVAAELRAADLRVAVGTSGAVHAAAGFAAQARARGVPTLEEAA